MAIKQECCKQYWTSPGANTPQGTNYMATCLLSWKLYKLNEPETQDTAGEARMNSSVMYSNGPPHMAKQKQDDQLEHTYSNYVRIRDVALKTYQKRWMIGRSGERGSGISVLAARHDDDDMFHIQLTMQFWFQWKIMHMWWTFWCLVPKIYVGSLLKSKRSKTMRTKENSKQSSTNKIKFIYQQIHKKETLQNITNTLI